ncbi:hypothetical protein HaLaN_32496, partial [Haematococcus lacustris]
MRLTRPSTQLTSPALHTTSATRRAAATKAASNQSSFLLRTSSTRKQTRWWVWPGTWIWDARAPSPLIYPRSASRYQQ